MTGARPAFGKSRGRVERGVLAFHEADPPEIRLRSARLFLSERVARSRESDPGPLARGKGR